MKSIRAILFDNDGTLVDTEQLILDSFKYATKKVLGEDIPKERLLAKVGQPLAVQMWDFSDSPETHDKLLEVYREYNHAMHDKAVHAFPGVIEGLTELKRRGYSLGVVSSKMHRLCWRGLSIVGAAPLLDCCVGADDCPEFKPSPAPILHGARLLGVPITECAYVGDAPFDIAAGNAAGCVTIACTWGIFENNVLQAENPSFTINDFSDLLEFFE